MCRLDMGGRDETQAAQCRIPKMCVISSRIRKPIGCTGWPLRHRDIHTHNISTTRQLLSLPITQTRLDICDFPGRDFGGCVMNDCHSMVAAQSSFNSGSKTKYMFAIMIDHGDVGLDYINTATVSLLILSSTTQKRQ
jgi:hypothetical protein